MSDRVEAVELAGVPAERFEFHLCTLVVAAPAPWILATQVAGLGSIEMVEQVIAFGDGLLESVPRIQIFHDFSAVTGYPAEARRKLVGWGVQRRDKILSTNVLFKSKVVAMGTSLATMLLPGQINGFARLHEFERARDAAVAAQPS